MDEAIWPLAGLAGASPRLRLRYVTDGLAAELARLAAQGVHDPAFMPFTTPWTDVASPELERNALRYFWRNRAETSVEQWDLSFAAEVDGTPVGVCSISADHFGEHRSAETGSWIGMRYQHKGLGREMRDVALHLIFEGFGAVQATTRAWHDNAASLAITRSLPYRPNGSSEHARRNHTDLLLHFEMSREKWLTVRRDDINLWGIDAAKEQLALP